MIKTLHEKLQSLPHAIKHDRIEYYLRISRFKGVWRVHYSNDNDDIWTAFMSKSHKDIGIIVDETLAFLKEYNVKSDKRKLDSIEYLAE